MAQAVVSTLRFLSRPRVSQSVSATTQLFPCLEQLHHNDSPRSDHESDQPEPASIRFQMISSHRYCVDGVDISEQILCKGVEIAAAPNLTKEMDSLDEEMKNRQERGQRSCGF